MNIAIVGATGLVGREVVKILIEKDYINDNNIDLFASKKSAGKIINILNNTFKIKELKEENLNFKYDYVFLCAGGEISKSYANLFLNKGAIVIDNSSAFRRDLNVPLVVPEVNFETIKNHKLIANPNCSTIGAVLPIFAILKEYKIKRVIISTYQAVSGAGQKGIDDYQNLSTNKFNYLINNNLIPQIDKALENGYTFEENKMEFELKKILNQDIKVCATCVRVPIKNCHSESINIQLDRVPNLNRIKQLLGEFRGIKVVDDLKNFKYPMPIFADETNDVYVGRIRKDTSNKRSINMFICFDNIRKGASLNAVQIMENLELKKNGHII